MTNEEKQEPDLIKHLDHCSEIVSRWPDWKNKGADATKFIQSLDEFEFGYLNGHAEACSNRPAPAVSLAGLVPEKWTLKQAEKFVEDYTPPSEEEAVLFAVNSFRAAILRNIEEAKR